VLPEEPQPRPARLAAIEADTRELGFTMASEPRTGSLLRTLAASKPGGRLLELGTGTGICTSWILEGMDPAATLVTIDDDERVLEVARRHLGGDPRVRFVAGDGAAFLAQRRGADERFDLVFADAWPGKYTDLEAALSLVAAGGFYLVDDMLEQPNWPGDHAPRAAGLIRALADHPEFHLTTLAWSSGLVLATRRP